MWKLTVSDEIGVEVEFSKEYARELLDMRRKIFGENEYQKAVDSLKNRDDSVEFFKEMISFFMN